MKILEQHETRRCLARHAILLLLLGVIMHVVFHYTSLYWAVLWLDMLVHGVIAAGLWFALWYVVVGFDRHPTHIISLASVLLITALLVWFEVVPGWFGPIKDFADASVRMDSWLDIIAGVAGIILAAFWSRSFCRYEVRKAL